MNEQQVRKIIKDQADFSPGEPLADPLADMKTFAAKGKVMFLLAHADDGVIWGRVENGDFVTADKAFPESAKFRPETLQEVRLFGKDLEVYYWRTDAGWNRRTISEGQGEEVEYYDESWILWGTELADAARQGFYPVKETDTGIQHAPPWQLKERHSLRLVTRHYLGYDERSAVVVRASRLVDLTDGGKQ